MPDPLLIDRVLADGPFAQIGDPAVATRSERLGLVAVGGDIGWLQWPGRDAGQRWRSHRVGVYRSDDLNCRHLLRSQWPVNALDFHPSLPLLAIGTGRYDGGYSFEGELLLLDLVSGQVVSVLEGLREVRKVLWRNERVLDVVLAPYDDWKDDEAHHYGVAVAIEHGDWPAATDGMVTTQEQTGRRVDCARPGTQEPARQMVVGLCDVAGVRWALRRQVWVLEELRDGRMLAALEGTTLECWLPSGRREWSVPNEVGGRQIQVSPDQQTAWANVPSKQRLTATGWEKMPGAVEQLSLHDGDVIAEFNAGFAAVLAARKDGWLAGTARD